MNNELNPFPKCGELMRKKGSKVQKEHNVCMRKLWEDCIIRGESMTGDCLIVGYDHSSDGTALTIAREENEGVRILNTIQGDVAFTIYHLLVGDETILIEMEQLKKIKQRKKLCFR